MPEASARVRSIPPSAIHEMTRLSASIPDVAFLSWAKPTGSPPPHVSEAVERALRDGSLHGYSPTAGLPELREAIAEKLARDNGIPASPSEVIVTVGAIEAISAALMAVVDPGDEVILPTPTYSTHINQVRLASGVPVFVPLREEDGWSLDLDALRDAITPRTRAILYCSPSNPTGTVFTEAELRAIAELALEHDLVVITDEAYEYFTFDGARHLSIAALPGLRDHVISCFTFTKTYAMTGWRVGYLHASPRWIPFLGRPHIAFAICAPVASQVAALAALRGSQDGVADFREKYRRARDLLCRRLDALPELFSYQRPRGSYLMFPRILPPEGRDSGAFCKRLLREAHVSTTPGRDFGPTGESHLRLSFCVPEEMIELAFDRIEAWWAERTP